MFKPFTNPPGCDARPICKPGYASRLARSAWRRHRETPHRKAANTLTFAEKVARLRMRWRDPEWRQYGMVLLLGKAMGIALLLSLVMGPSLVRVASEWIAPVVHAQAAPDPYKAVMAGDLINPVNTGWVLLGAFLVFGMQAGFTMLEAGFCRNRETVNVLVECMFDTCVCGLLHWGWGFAFMFGEGNPFIGWHLPGDPTKSLIFLKDIDVTSVYGSTGIPIFAHYLFQFAFADCASTICSGAMVGRTRFVGDVLYSIGVSGLIYPILGHWCWGPDGFLATMGSDGHFLSSLGMNFHDFAGSTVVHSIGGWVAIAGAIMLGPRLGRRFKRDGGGPMPPHDLTIAVIGGLILWFGWYGFNPCSTLSLMDHAGVARVATNTTSPLALAVCRPSS
jgi:Amt family ammonium transporter